MFFCKNEHTNGIFPNKAKMVFSPPPGSKKRKKMINVRCSNTRYVLSDKKRYCRMCYANHSENIKKSVNKDKRKTKKYSDQSNLGCPACYEPICDNFSQTCSRSKEGHQRDATYHDRKGGSDFTLNR